MNNNPYQSQMMPNYMGGTQGTYQPMNSNNMNANPLNNNFNNMQNNNMYNPSVMPNNQNTYGGNPYMPNPQVQPQNIMTTGSQASIEAMYPEIYKMVYPMVVKAVQEATASITEKILEEMVDNIYRTIEPEEIPATPRTTGITDARKDNRVPPPFRPQKRPNRYLRDLIRILFIQELLKGRRPSYGAFPYGY